MSRTAVFFAGLVLTHAIAGAQGRPASGASLKLPVTTPGRTIDAIRPELAGLCRTLKERDINPPFRVLRDVVKRKQVQLDCDGFSYFGKPRFTEFVVADDTLQMVWILTDSSDHSGLMKAMTDAFGAPTHRNEKFIAFTQARIAIRTDRPEVLLYAERLAAGVLPWFGNPSTFR